MEATEFYRQIYKEEQNMDFNWESRRPKIRNHLETLPILESEVKAILQKLKTDKCPGPDKINHQHLKTLSTILNKPLIQ